jgi:heterodisulfide reductase subunit C
MTENKSKSKKKSSTNNKIIKMENLDPNFKYEVAKEHGGENIKRCFSCGTCSAICPVFSVNSKYNPRKIIRMIQLGMKKEVLESYFIWLCSGCYSCYEICPRDVKITNIMSALRNIASRNGFVPDNIIASVDLLEKYGRLLEVSEFENTIRNKKNIPELKLTIPEIKKLLEKSDIYDIVKEHHLISQYYGGKLYKDEDLKKEEPKKKKSKEKESNKEESE